MEQNGGTSVGRRKIVRRTIIQIKSLISEYENSGPGLSSYTAAFKDNEQVTLMGCMAHIRRGFKKAQKQNKALADEVLTYFNIIYRIEPTQIKSN